MATLLELNNIYENSGNLYRRLRVRCALLANYILGEDPGTQNHAARKSWALSALADPDIKAKQLFWFVLADVQVTGANAVALAQGTAPDDAAIQSIVDVYLPNVLS